LGKHARILVVDDDENITATLQAILENEGYAVDVAANGTEAIKKSKSAVYNVTLIDIKLPDMEGTELLTRMSDSVPRTRKIIVTGYPSMQNAIDAVNKNADAYLMKPVDMDKLLRAVSEQLKLQEAEKKYCEEKVTEFIAARVNEIAETQKLA
jgi:DNA-binding NtrC family response regulator